MNKTFTLEVRGDGPFPFEMLRYACCWPARLEDAQNINAPRARTIKLSTMVRPVPFHLNKWVNGWQVIAVDGEPYPTQTKALTLETAWIGPPPDVENENT
jgi:hypothetical protein